jgi:putative MATE family efflux protein
MPAGMIHPMSDGSIGRRLASMALPLACGLAGTMGAQLVMTAYIGSLGVAALAAAGFIFPVVTLVLNIGIGMSAATSSVVGREAGAGGRAMAARLATDALILALALAVAVAVLGTFAMPVVFRLLGAPRESMTLIVPYMRLWYLGSPLFIGSLVGLGALRALGDATFQGLMLLLSALLSVVLARALIFGLYEAPPFGFVGAAAAAVLAWVPLFAGTLYRMSKLDLLLWRVPSEAEFKESARRLLRIALPATATNAIIPVSVAIITSMLARFGPIAVAGFGVATRIEGVAMIVFFALSGVMNPFVAQNAGAADFIRIRSATRLVFQFCLLWGAAIAGLLYEISPWLLKQISSNAEVIQIALEYLSIVPLSYGAAGIVMNINATFNGLDQPGPAVLVSSARVIGINVPAAWLGGLLLGAPGLFAGIGVANVLVALLGGSWLSRIVRDRVALTNLRRRRARNVHRHTGTQ